MPSFDHRFNQGGYPMKVRNDLRRAGGRRRQISRVTTSLLFVLLGATSALAQTVTTIFNFNGTKGSSPFLERLTQGRDGKLYGTTYTGGASDLGTVFRVDPASGHEIVIHSFDGTNGSNPAGGLTLASNGDYFGTTQYGGSAGDGVLYEITSGGTYIVLHQFLGGSDGSYPYGPPIEASDGSLYGTNSGGNTEAPTIYKVTRAGAYSAVYTYDKATTGWLVYGLIQGSDGLLYTMSNQGGSGNCGTIVKLALSGQVKATFPFNCANGGNPVLPLIQANDGNYYGTTFGGGAHNSGVIFKLTPSFTEKVLYEFGSGQATEPEAGLVQGTDGNFYGVTTTGADDNSHLYRWSGSAGYSDLYTFTGVDYLVAPLLQHTNGRFYAPSWKYGTENMGYVYSVDMKLGPFVTFVQQQGKVGSTAEILGQGFTGTTSITFDGIAASFKVVSDTYVTAVVPTRAMTGPVVVTTPGGILKSNKNFTVSR